MSENKSNEGELFFCSDINIIYHLIWSLSQQW